MKHTPEPFYTDSDRDVSFIYSGMEKVCQFFDRDEDDFDNKDANAKRIVECVNAMEGIKDPAEFMEVVKQLELDAYQKLKQQIQNSELRNVVAKEKAPELFKQQMLKRLTADELMDFDHKHPLFYTAAVEVFTDIYGEFLKFQNQTKTP